MIISMLTLLSGFLYGALVGRADRIQHRYGTASKKAEVFCWNGAAVLGVWFGLLALFTRGNPLETIAGPAWITLIATGLLVFAGCGIESRLHARTHS